MPERDVDALVGVARAHILAESVGDLDATLATLDPDPVYELLPMGVTLRGADFVKAYYERLTAECVPRFVDPQLRNEWIVDEGFVLETSAAVDLGDGLRRHHTLTILTFGDHGVLSGERVYASDELHRFVFGPWLPPGV